MRHAHLIMCCANDLVFRRSPVRNDQLARFSDNPVSIAGCIITGSVAKKNWLFLSTDQLTDITTIHLESDVSQRIVEVDARSLVKLSPP